MVGLLTVPTAQPGERPRLLPSFNVIDMGSVRIAEGATDVPEIRTAIVHECLVGANTRQEEIHPLPGSPVSHTPTTTKTVILCTVAYLPTREIVILCVRHSTH